MTLMTSDRWQHKRRLSLERASKMGIASQRAQAEQRMRDAADRIGEQAKWDVLNLPRRQGDALGCLEWHDYRSGRVRRWVVRIGSRRDRITVESPVGPASPSHGWTWFLTQLRKHLS